VGGVAAGARARAGKYGQSSAPVARQTSAKHFAGSSVPATLRHLHDASVRCGRWLRTSTARSNEGLTRQRPDAVTIVAVRPFSRATVPLILRPSSVSNSTTIPTENFASCVRLLADRMSCRRSTIRRFSVISSSSDSVVSSITMQRGQYTSQQFRVIPYVLRRLPAVRFTALTPPQCARNCVMNACSSRTSTASGASASATASAV
jgi:hypothetical protein